jgi:hypothetical protein
MLKLVVVVAGLLVLVLAGGAFAQSEADLSGSWTVEWLSNNSKNPMSLTLTGKRFSGSYTNDAKDSCSVSGNFDTTSNRLALQIVCPDWDIRMEGSASADGKVIEGTYRAYIDANRQFHDVEAIAVDARRGEASDKKVTLW